MMRKTLIQNNMEQDSRQISALVTPIENTGKQQFVLLTVINLSSVTIQGEDPSTTVGSEARPCCQHKVAARTKKDVHL